MDSKKLFFLIKMYPALSNAYPAFSSYPPAPLTIPCAVLCKNKSKTLQENIQCLTDCRKQNEKKGASCGLIVSK